MKDKIEKLFHEIKEYKAAGQEEIEAFRLKFLSKKGAIQGLFADFRNVPNEEKRQMGKLLNDLKTAAQERFDGMKDKLGEKDSDEGGTIDLSLPVDFRQSGSRHPLSITANEIVRIFDGMGFSVAEGPEIEDDWHNFSALNFPEDHPARDMQDTFFIEEKPSVSLRTHTSSVQIRYMENNRPPLRAIFPGRVFRNEAISARAHCIFHQVEGLYVDKDVSFADLKLTLLTFARDMFGPDTGIRLRPSYFPFTEPSAEMDISCMICKGKGCNICKYTGWVEILGCGMVDPNVLKNCNIDPDIYSGFAFGMGVERIAMLKYQVKDIRLFFENDLRFLDQFKSSF